MPNVINLDKMKISVMSFSSRDDFARFMRNLDSLFDRAKRFPVFYILTDDSTKPEDLKKVQDWLQEMQAKTDDIEMVQRNLQAGRFPELTGEIPS